MRRQESHHRCLCVQAESIVVQVDSVKVREVEDGCEEVGESLGDFVQKSTGEDVRKVGDLDLC